MRDLPREWPDWMDCKATVALLVASITASATEFLGTDQSHLHLNSSVVAAEPWRLFTTTLLHGDWLHLAFNVYWTVRLGFVLESIFGSAWMLLLYLFLGFGSSAAQWAFDGPGVGLSGIGYGLFGLLWALYRFHPRYRPAIDDRVIELFVAWFFVCIALDWFDVMPIGNWAHGSGAVLGGLLGWTIAPRRTPRALRAGLLVATCAVIALASTIGRTWINPGGLARERAYELLAATSELSLAQRLESLEALVRRHPNSAEAWMVLGAARSEGGDHAKGWECIRRAHELEPANERYRKMIASLELTLAIQARMEANQARAREHLRTSVDLDPNNQAAWIELAEVLETLQDPTGALEALDRAEAIAPLPPRATTVLQRLRPVR